MNFRDLACGHLSRYKVEALGVNENGIFRYRGRSIPKSHILPLDHRDANILERYRAQFFASDYARIKFHEYFHHLNSSQALCINFFYPLIAENRMDLFLSFLGVNSATGFKALFEKESDIEQAKRRTSFDFYAQLADAGNIFVEVKYTEAGFASAKKDEEHRKKFRETYLPLLAEKSSFLAPECMEESFFLDHYQVLRNLVHVNDKDYVVLFFPSANARVAEESTHAMDYLLSDKGRKRLRIVFLEEIVTFLEGKCANNALDGYYQKFRTKYLPDDGKEIRV
jgi:hypothetical protein